MLERADVVNTLQTVTSVFNILTGVIAGISLFIAFFLLLIATTQNVTSAIWEYGVLRSMGVKRSEGRRIFMYEAFLVVVSAAILGTIVGFCTASAVALQFYSFIELPAVIEFPTYIFVVMICLALITTAIAVIAPVSKVN